MFMHFSGNSGVLTLQTLAEIHPVSFVNSKISR
jgi:hypothetical protein